MSTNKRYRLTPDEAEILFRYRGLKAASEEAGVDVNSVKHGWLKTKQASLFFKNPLHKDEAENKLEELSKKLIEDLKEFAPKFPKLVRKEKTKDYLLVIDPADIHIGKLADSFETGEDYNNQIAVKRVKEGVQGILNKAQGFPIEDTDGQWYSNFLIAKQLYVDILLQLIAVADVHFTFNPSNHDYQTGFFLADVIKTHFRNCKNISFDCSIAHRKGYKYGSNLIGTTHGDGAKHQDLPLLMATEFPVEWSETKHRYVYTHHVHHKTSKDYIGVTVESLRSPSGSDSWHHKKGYLSLAAVEGFIHHRENGQVARLTHLF